MALSRMVHAAEIRINKLLVFHKILLSSQEREIASGRWVGDCRSAVFSIA